MNNTIIWISDDAPNFQKNPHNTMWCKTSDDAKHSIQEYEIEHFNVRFGKSDNIPLETISKIIVENYCDYSDMNNWLKDTNRQYLLDKVEVIPKEISSGDIKFEIIRYILTYVNDNRTYYFSQKDEKRCNKFWSSDIRDAIMYNTEIEAEEQERQIKIYDKINASVRKIKINAKINYIY